VCGRFLRRISGFCDFCGKFGVWCVLVLIWQYFGGFAVLRACGFRLLWYRFLVFWFVSGVCDEFVVFCGISGVFTFSGVSLVFSVL